MNSKSLSLYLLAARMKVCTAMSRCDIRPHHLLIHCGSTALREGIRLAGLRPYDLSQVVPSGSKDRHLEFPGHPWVPIGSLAVKMLLVGACILLQDVHGGVFSTSPCSLACLSPSYVGPELVCAAVTLPMASELDPQRLYAASLMS